jgi:hypothetical protein
MSELPREITGATAWERAVTLAGLLAELGEKRVVLEAGGLVRELRARETDLPAELVRLGRGVLVAPTVGVRFAVTPEGIIRE